ncbi:MAG: BPSS1780 family membrane protein [Rhodocyclaceae bacterium]|nr:BPSS1780 family membrane protein [Rhodocyclaceae bacterium]
MQAHRLPSRRGWFWIAEGFRLFRRNPSLLGFLVFGYWFLLLLLDLVPFIGPVAAGLCVPAMSVSVMNGCRAIENGQRVDPGSLLLSGFKTHPRVLAALGAINFSSWLLLLVVGSAIDGGTLMRAMMGSGVVDADMLGDARVQFAALATLLLMVPVLMAFWFSPLLVAWENCGAAKALFFSFIASWRNGGAFFTYGLGLMLVSALLPGLFLGLLASLSTTLFSFVAAALTLPLILVFMPTLFASFYVSYRDVFREEEPEPPLEADEGSSSQDAQPPDDGQA